MYHPTTRVLAALELLQVHRRLSGADLAARLEVDRRTVRRYITMLQDLGIPIDAEPGRHGGYRLRPNFRLPPLMFTEDEALALALGLLAARRIGFTTDPTAIEAALAKIERALPPTLREHLIAIQETITLDLREAVAPPPGVLVAALGAAARLERQVRLRYRSRSRDETARLVDPYGVVYHAGLWYVVGHCHLRHDTRIFRLDRILAAEWSDEPISVAPPADFDPLAFVARSLAHPPAPTPPPSPSTPRSKPSAPTSHSPSSPSNRPPTAPSFAAPPTAHAGSPPSSPASTATSPSTTPPNSAPPSTTSPPASTTSPKNHTH